MKCIDMPIVAIYGIKNNDDRLLDSSNPSLFIQNKNILS